MSRGLVNYKVARELARTLQPPLGRSPHNINNTKNFVEQVRNITLGTGGCITSCDTIILLTSVTIVPVLNIIQDQLDQNWELAQRIKLTTQHIIELLGFCLHNTYFISQGRYYEQVERAVEGSPIQPHGGKHIHGTF